MKDIESDTYFMTIAICVLALFLMFVFGFSVSGNKISDSCNQKGIFENDGVVFECKPVSIKVGDIEAPIPTTKG